MSDLLPFDVVLPRERVTDETSAILRAMAGDPIHANDRARIVSAIVYCANHNGGVVDSNMVRARLVNDQGQLVVYPRLLSAMYSHLARQGVLERSGWSKNQDRAGRNVGKPARLYFYRRAAA